MKKSTKIILSIVGVGIIGAGAYLLIKRFRTPAYIPPTINGNPNVTPVRNTRNDSFPLKQGSLGAKVKELQAYLNNGGCTPLLKVDGDWGPLTQSCFSNSSCIDEGDGKTLTKEMYNTFVVGKICRA
tara:strand:+ start:449 stop:829 length:381 start_codon:yes stop_codon:yes gene_type:complete